ncbi:hypothetical protein J6590_087244 [Homalodisca vitripennis]|nr:hypothetical protein J6590_087244 [Homalodisca vitripennis]
MPCVAASNWIVNLDNCIMTRRWAGVRLLYLHIMASVQTERNNIVLGYLKNEHHHKTNFGQGHNADEIVVVSIDVLTTQRAE